MMKKKLGIFLALILVVLLAFGVALRPEGR